MLTNYLLHHGIVRRMPKKILAFPTRPSEKGKMPAALGNAVHNSVEDLCNLDLADREDDEAGWLPATAKAVLDRHWQPRKITS